MTRFRKKTLRALVAYLTETPVATTGEIAEAFGFNISTASNYLRGHPDLFQGTKLGSGKTTHWRLKK